MWVRGGYGCFKCQVIPYFLVVVLHLPVVFSVSLWLFSFWWFVSLTGNSPDLKGQFYISLCLFCVSLWLLCVWGCSVTLWMCVCVAVLPLCGCSVTLWKGLNPTLGTTGLSYQTVHKVTKSSYKPTSYSHKVQKVHWVIYMCHYHHIQS